MFVGTLPLFAQGAALGISAAATPGPFQTFLISQTLINGRKNGILVAFAPVVSDLPIVIITLILLQQLPDWFLSVISVLGGFFALYIASGIFRSWRELHQEQDEYSDRYISDADENTNPARNEYAHLFGKAVLMNWLSPGLYMFWALVNGPIVLSAFKDSSINGLAFLAGFYTIFTGGLILLVLLFDQARKLGQKLVNILLFISIIILTGFGIFLIYRGVSSLVHFA